MVPFINQLIRYSVSCQVLETESRMPGTNGVVSSANLQNGYTSSTNGGSPDSSNQRSSQPFRWVLCTNLEAAPTSPVYQIFTSGYPNDESLDRLRAVRNIHLNGYDYMDGTVSPWAMI